MSNIIFNPYQKNYFDFSSKTTNSVSAKTEEYFSPELVKIRDGDFPALICIDGFLTKGTDTSQEWLAGLPCRYAARAVYVLRWDSKNIEDFSALLDLMTDYKNFDPIMYATSHAWNGIAQQDRFAYAESDNGDGWLTKVYEPWLKARDNAHNTGMWLAFQIQNMASEDRDAINAGSFVLLGHSLGARVIYYCLDALRTLSQTDQRLSNTIAQVYLFGGAVGHSANAGSVYNDGGVSNTVNWHGFNHLVKGQINNYYSDQDNVLKYLFLAAENLNETYDDTPNEEPIGLNPIINFSVRNHDVSHYVPGHTQYKENLYSIMSLV